MALPSGFGALREVLTHAAKEDGSYFLGVITHIQAPMQPKVGGGWVLNFTIKDKFPGDEKDSVACELMRWRKDQLPHGDPGDVAILRNMKLEIRGKNNTKTLVNSSGLQSEATFFPTKSIPAPEISHDYQPGGTSNFPFSGMPSSRAPSCAEQTAIVNIKAAAAPLLEDLKKPRAMFLARIGTSQSNFKKGKKQALLKDMTFNAFYNFVGEVVKTFWGTSESVDLYVTDYTTNEDLFLYEEKTDYDYSGGYSGGSRKSWPGPFGQMTMQVRLYDSHAGVARDVKEGDFVFLQNIRTKLSQMNKLEGAIHADTQYPDKKCIRKCTHQAQLGELMKRKAEYEQSRAKSILARNEPENVPKKPSAIASARKKQSKKERKRLEKERERKELEQKAKEVGTIVKGLNNNILTGDEEVALSTADEIVNSPWLKTTTETGDELILPFVNSRYRTRLRVVDHYPLRLKSFTRSAGTPDASQATAATTSTDSQPHSQSGIFEWHFFLLVEDANATADTTPTRFPLTIDTRQAQCLLGIDPVDLSARPDKLSKLEQKLFLLWGNLHERKVALKKEGINLPLPVGDKKLALSNKPFVCCIEEYGVPVDDKGLPFTDKELDNLPVEILGNPKTWKRTWGLHNTTIRD